jgi:ribosomal-protein-alanine N-acetyltransferase
VGPGPQFELAGPRVRLRFATAADAPALYELGRNREVTRFFSWGPYTELAQAEAYIARLAGERDAGAQLDFLITAADGVVVGVTGLSEFALRDRRAIVGTWLGREWWGTGVNAESKALVTRLAFEHLGLERVGAYAAVGNPRSQVALERLGFVREGTLRRFHRHGAEVHDVLVFSLLREEWERSALAAVPASASGSLPPAFLSR